MLFARAMRSATCRALPDKESKHTLASIIQLRLVKRRQRRRWLAYHTKKRSIQPDAETSAKKAWNKSHHMSFMSTRSHSHLQTKTDRIKCSRLLHHRTRHSRNTRGLQKSESKFFQRFPDVMTLDWFNWSRLSVSVICVLQRRASLVKCVNNNATASSGNRFHCSNFETFNVSRSSFDLSQRWTTIWHRCTECRPRRFYAKKNVNVRSCIENRGNKRNCTSVHKSRWKLLFRRNSIETISTGALWPIDGALHKS